jgi:hypothetical protein
MKKITYLLSLFTIITCSATDKISIKNVSDLTAYGPNTFVYSLPRTRIKINVSALRLYTVPGPYAQYAEKYMGMEGQSTVSEKWEIKGVDFETFEEPDPDYYYAIEIEKGGDILKNVLEISQAGLILKVDASNPFVQYLPDYSTYQDQRHFTDLSIKKNYIDPNDPEKVKAKKSDFPEDIPTGKHKPGVKSTEEKAEEAANFILKIRKRRFKLISGQYDSFPGEASIETSVRELNKLEQSYLSLFIGKTYTDTLTKTFYYIPQPDQEIDRFVICYFSSNTGFEDTQEGTGKSLVLELKDLQLTAPLDRLEMTTNRNDGANCMMYRIPDKASVRIYFGSLVTMEGEVKVFQYGTLVPYCIAGK